ncbi:MAG: NADH-quinone oxidoreductase subunit N [Isosphaeraceae bacterium]
MNPEAFYSEVSTQALRVLIPELVILLTATVVMTLGAFTRQPRRIWSLTSFLTLVVALITLYGVRSTEADAYGSVVLNDAFSWWTRLGFLLSGLILVAMAHDQVDDSRAPEFFGSILMVVAGSMVVGAANDLVLLFVGLELVSIPTYLLLYLSRRNVATQEAAIKYFFLSVFSSGLLLFGLAYLYGIAGVGNLKALAYCVQKVPFVPNAALALVAIVFVMAGLGFRVAAVPFHFYAPDVYEGSPTIVTAMLAWIPKGVGFVAILRALTSIFAQVEVVSQRGAILGFLLAIATMTVGNLMALRQSNLKRLLAYSSIAHAGYLLIGVVAAFRNSPQITGQTSQAATLILGSEGVLLYLATYALMTLGAFAVLLMVDTPDRPVESVDDLNGLSKSHPLAALLMGLCLFSLAGVPPLAGFWGKFWVFSSALGAIPPQAEEGPGMMVVLVVLGGLNAAIGAYYYLRLVIAMYLKPAEGVAVRPRAAWPTTLAAASCAILSLLLGCYSTPLQMASREAAVSAIAQPGMPSTASNPGTIRTASLEREAIP